MSKAQVELRVTGLAEPGAVRSMEEMLSALPGVEYAHVNLGAAKITINYDDSITEADALTAAVKRAGFTATQS
jgi:copper chaperone CopZ